MSDQAELELANANLALARARAAARARASAASSPSAQPAESESGTDWQKRYDASQMAPQFLEEAANALTLGHGPELMAGAQHLLKDVPGLGSAMDPTNGIGAEGQFTPDMSYEDKVKLLRKRLETGEEKFPTASTLGLVTGVASGMKALPAVNAGKAITAIAGKGALANIGAGALTGAATGALYGGLQNPGEATDYKARIHNALNGTIFGSLLGGGMSGGVEAFKAIPSLGKGALKTLLGVKPETTERYLERPDQVRAASTGGLKSQVDQAQSMLDKQEAVAAEGLGQAKQQYTSAREEIKAAVKAEKERISQEMFNLQQSKLGLKQDIASVEGGARSQASLINSQGIAQKQALLEDQARDVLQQEQQAMRALDEAEQSHAALSEPGAMSARKEALVSEQQNIANQQIAEAQAKADAAKQSFLQEHGAKLSEVEAQAAPPTDMAGALQESVKELKNSINKSSSAAYDVLGNTPATVDLSKHAQGLVAQAEGLKVRGNFPTSAAESEYNQLVGEAKRLSDIGAAGPLPVADAKAVIQGIDKIAYNTEGLYPGSFQGAMRTVRNSIDQDLKAIAPKEYAQIMADVSAKRKLLEQVYPMADETKAIRALGAVGKETATPTTRAIQDLGNQELNARLAQRETAAQSLANDPKLAKYGEQLPQKAALDEAKSALDEALSFNKARVAGAKTAEPLEMGQAAKAKDALLKAKDNLAETQRINKLRLQASKTVEPLEQGKLLKLDQQSQAATDKLNKSIDTVEEKITLLKNPKLKSRGLLQAAAKATSARKGIAAGTEALDKAQNSSKALKNLTEGTSEGFVNSLVRDAGKSDKGIYNKQAAEQMSNILGDDIMAGAKDLAAKRNFEAANTMGSRNVAMGGMLGAGLAQSLGLNPVVGTALGGAIGGVVDKYGPQIGQRVLDATMKIKGPQTFQAIAGSLANTGLPGEVIKDIALSMSGNKQQPPNYYDYLRGSK